MKKTLLLSTLILASATTLLASDPAITGDYLEVRSCDVFTGHCFANGEMGLIGKEGMMVWSVKQGSWNGVALDGLNVIAVVRTDATLGDVRHQPRRGPAVLVVDAKADARQREALSAMARSLGGCLTENIVAVKSSPIEASMNNCAKSGCASVKAGDLVQISTRCLGDKDHICGNEQNYYPPLTIVQQPLAAFTEMAAYKGTGLDLTFESTGKRSAFLGTFVK